MIGATLDMHIDAVLPHDLDRAREVVTHEEQDERTIKRSTTSQTMADTRDPIVVRGRPPKLTVDLL